MQSKRLQPSDPEADLFVWGVLQGALGPGNVFSIAEGCRADNVVT